jgi:hypothetical protein
MQGATQVIDKTTEGYAPTDGQVDGLVRNLCAYALSEPEAMQRYVELTHQQVLFDGMVSAIRRERARALVALAESGVPIAEVAQRAKLTPQLVRSLVKDAGLALPKSRSVARRKATPGRAMTRKPPTSPMPPALASTSASAKAQPGATSVPSRGPALPASMTGGRGEERTLTAEERLALGLPALRPVQRRQPATQSGQPRQPAAQGGPRRHAAAPDIPHRQPPTPPAQRRPASTPEAPRRQTPVSQPARTDSKRADPRRADPTRRDPTQADPKRREPKRAEPQRADRKAVEPKTAERKRGWLGRREPSRSR